MPFSANPLAILFDAAQWQGHFRGLKLESARTTSSNFGIYIKFSYSNNLANLLFPAMMLPFWRLFIFG
jgi:hypothetical protein